MSTTEDRTYTREDMARARSEGRESGTIAAMLKLRYGVMHQPLNPYDWEEA